MQIKPKINKPCVLCLWNFLFPLEIYLLLLSDKTPTWYHDSKHLQNKAETGERSLKLKLLRL